MCLAKRGDEECFRDQLVNENINEQCSDNQAIPPRGTIFFICRFEKQSGTQGCLAVRPYVWVLCMFV
jgi:hypothetical protein